MLQPIAKINKDRKNAVIEKSQREQIGKYTGKNRIP